jgi:hypothetical protein
MHTVDESPMELAILACLGLDRANHPERINIRSRALVGFNHRLHDVRAIRFRAHAYQPSLQLSSKPGQLEYFDRVKER